MEILASHQITGIKKPLRTPIAAIAIPTKSAFFEELRATIEFTYTIHIHIDHHFRPSVN